MGASSNALIDDKGNIKHIIIDKYNGHKKPYIGNNISDFEEEKFLGKGKFGKVILVKSKITNKYYAMKKLEIKENNIQDIDKEIKLLESLDHPNIINYYTSFYDYKNYYIVIEYMNDKTIKDIIEQNIKNNVFLEEKKIWELLIQCLSGLFYLHIKKKIIHRDIKPDNLILDKDEVIKISDFGVSFIESNDVEEFFKFNGKIQIPFKHVAPEVLEGNHKEFKSDLFMLGLTFFYLSSNQQYLTRIRVNNMIQTIYTNAKFPERYTKELENFILSLLKNLYERPNIEKAFLEALNIYTFKYLKSKSSGILSIIFCFNSIKNLEQFFNSNDISLYFEKNSDIKYLYINLFKKALFYADENNYNYDELNSACLHLMVLYYYKKEVININQEISLMDFLYLLINSLNKELSKNPELIKSSLNEELIDGTNEEEVMNSILKKLQKNKTIINDEFSYIEKRESKCINCNTIIKYSSSIEYICLLFPDKTAKYLNKKNIDIHDLFSHYRKIRRYNGEKIFCKKCNQVQYKVDKIKSFYNFPKNFIIYIRYEKQNMFNLEINEIIDIKDFVENNYNNNTIEYILSGAVFSEFKGKEKFYTSITKNKNGDWKYFDGKYIHNSNFDDLKNHKNVKILIYSYLE